MMKLRLASLVSLAAIVNLAAAFQAPRAVLLQYKSSASVERGVPLQAKYKNHDIRQKQRDVFLLSLDGTLTSSIRSKSHIVIRAALQVWPPLISTAQILGLNTKSLDDSWNWLIEKLCALSSITQQGNSPDRMLGCDAAFLVRVLLEEQLLDGGRSNGRGGKYGGKFHPGALGGVESDGSAVGSRPLTVGELYSNWTELREVVNFKYPFVDVKGRKMDPIPKIRQVLEELYLDEAQNANTRQSWHPLAYDAILECQNTESCEIRENSIILIGHEAQLPLALASFESMGISFTTENHLDWDVPCFHQWLQSRTNAEGDAKIAITPSRKACGHYLTRQNSVVLVVPNANEQETQSDVIQRIVLDFNSKSASHDGADDMSISVVHSSLDVLKQCKLFLNDDAPTLSGGIRKCLVPGPSTTSVNLLLPEWADNIHPTQKNDAVMDPWLNIVTETQFMESITAKIVSNV